MKPLPHGKIERCGCNMLSSGPGTQRALSSGHPDSGLSSSGHEEYSASFGNGSGEAQLSPCPQVKHTDSLTKGD
jgi:hypothetical protein